MARLTKIQIKNYRSVKDSGEVFITKLFALIGRNNTGKSSFLKAIQVLFGEIKEVAISDYHKNGPDPIEIIGVIKKWDKEEEKELKIKVFCAKGEKPKYFINDDEKGFAAYIKAVPSLLVIPDRRDAAEFSTAGNKNTLLKKILAERKNVNQEELDGISRKLEEVKRIEATEVSKLITGRFCEITQEKTFEVKIEPDVDVDKSTTHTSTLVDRDIPNAPTVGITESGTGMQSMYLLTLLDVYGDISRKSDDGILIIEEPEVYLHPDYQRRMFIAMRKIATNNQVIFSTHSPIMISEIWLTESVRQVRLESGETKIEEVKVEEVIKELGIRYEDVLNPKLVIFVEGRSDVAFYEKLGLKTSDKVAFVPTDGFRSMHYFAYVKIISSENVGSTFIAIADSDGEEPEKRIANFRKEIEGQFKEPSEKMLKRINDPKCLFVLEKYSIESYFLTVETLFASFPMVERSDIEKIVTHYHSFYKQKLSEVKDKNDLGQFQKYAGPKLLFDKMERGGDVNLNFENAYYSFWGDNEDFKRVREQLILECEKLGNSWFNHILSHTDLEQFDELIAIRKKITALI